MVQLVGPPDRSRRNGSQRSQSLRDASVNSRPLQPQSQPIRSRPAPRLLDDFRPVNRSFRPLIRPAAPVYRQQQSPVQQAQQIFRVPEQTLTQPWFKRLFVNKIALGSGLMAISLIVAATILILPRKTLSQTELEFFRQQLSTIRENSKEVKKYNNQAIDQAVISNNIDGYNEVLLSSLVACEEIDTHVSMTSEEVMKPYIESINQVRLFCDDYEDVVDYARKVSKASKQLLTYDTRNLTDRQDGSSLTDTMEILTYTRTDLEELKGMPAQDPANEEMLIMIDTLLKEGDAVKKDNSWDSLRAYAENTQKLQTNFMTSRKYYWTNTVKIDALLRSVDRLHGLFEEENL